jgi:hypothetical protein
MAESDGNAPTAVIDDITITTDTAPPPAPEQAIQNGVETTPDAPVLTPPTAMAGLGGEEEVAAAGWHSGKAITRTYHSGANNSWIALAGVGWRRISPANESACGAMTIIAAHAVDNGRNVNAYEGDDGHIHQLYCW